MKIIICNISFGADWTCTLAENESRSRKSSLYHVFIMFIFIQIYNNMNHCATVTRIQIANIFIETTSSSHRLGPPSLVLNYVILINGNIDKWGKKVETTRALTNGDIIKSRSSLSRWGEKGAIVGVCTLWFCFQCSRIRYRSFIRH